MKSRDDKVITKFYILCVVGRLTKDYNTISKEIRKEIDKSLKDDLFSWDDVPGKDNEKLIRYLKQEFIEGITAENAKIERIECNTIKVSYKNNFLYLRLNDERTKVNLTIDDGRKDEFFVENGTLKILEKHSFQKNESLQNDNESWYIWHGQLPIRFKNSIEDCDITIKHFKVRIIIEVTRKYKTEDFVGIFKKVRRERNEIIENYLIDNLLSIKIDKIVEKIYFFPLVQIFQEYKSKDFNKFDDENEAISSFMYEVPDARRESIGSVLFAEPKKTLIRVSRPSIIATKMSRFMLSEIINSIYDTSLVSLRKDKSTEISEEIFHNMRDYIGKVLFDHEETVSNVEMTRSVNTLSIIMSIGAFATILTIIYYPIQTIKSMESIKTLIGLILVTIIFIIGFLFVRSKRCR